MSSRRGATLQLVGLAELKRNMGELVPHEVQGLLRNTAGEVAGEMRDDMRARIPPNVAHYKTAIAVHRPRVGRGVVAADVVAKRTPPRAFYIHGIVEHGTEERFTKTGQPRGKIQAQPFERPVVELWRPKVMARFQEVLDTRLADFWERRRTGAPDG